MEELNDTSPSQVAEAFTAGPLSGTLEFPSGWRQSKARTTKNLVTPALPQPDYSLDPCLC
eukprot:1156994-Pelagomonas_calceolata.AAC.7